MSLLSNNHMNGQLTQSFQLIVLVAHLSYFLVITSRFEFFELAWMQIIGLDSGLGAQLLALLVESRRLARLRID